VSEPVTEIVTPIRMEYRYTPGMETSTTLRAIKEGRLIGRKCPSCEKVYFPARAVCSMCGEAFSETVELKDTGTLVTFATVNVNFANRTIDLPYVAGEVRFDGADTTTSVLVSGLPVEEARMGMRVKAHWLPQDQWDFTLANIDYVEPLDEPDVPFESYRELV
jgi:uncharacterized OB-fold protein